MPATPEAKLRRIVWITTPMFLAVIYYPTLRWLVNAWLGSPYYSHGFLIPPISAALAWRLARTTHASAPEQPSRALGLIVLSIGLAAYLIALWRRAYLVSAATLIASLAGVTLFLAGRKALRRQLFPIAFLSAMIPLPWLEQGAPILARWAAEASGWAAKGVGIDVAITGAQVELPGAAFVVGAPCSGVNSLAALLTLATLCAYLVRGPLPSRIALPALALPIALLANLIRLTVMIALAAWVSADVALGFYHDWSGLLLFALAVGGLILIGKALRCDGMRSGLGD